MEWCGLEVSPRRRMPWEAVFGTKEDNGLIDAYMCEMHDMNKLILAQLINDEMCDRIKLERSE